MFEGFQEIVQIGILDFVAVPQMLIELCRIPVFVKSCKYRWVEHRVGHKTIFDADGKKNAARG